MCVCIMYIYIYYGDKDTVTNASELTEITEEKNSSLLLLTTNRDEIMNK